MNPLKKTTKGFSLVEVLISIVILAIMAGALLLSNNSQKKSQEVQLATRTLAAQLRLMQNDALNGKTINGKNICGIEMFFKNESEYEINYYSQCSGFDFLGNPENNEEFNLQKSKLGTVAGNWIKFLAPYGLVKLSLGENNNGVLLESKDSDQQMVVCLGEAGNIEEIKGDDQFCVGAGMCEPNCSGKTCGDDGCGGSCGSCILPQTCNALGTCCVPNCSGKTCGDDGCGGSCGSCILPQTCSVLGTCCAPNCSGKTCGDDGCGGSCGSCADPLECSDTHFICAMPINDCEELQKNMPKDAGAVSELVNDIDCSDTKNWDSGQGFKPIQSFSAKLYGNGKSINNLYINRAQQYVGLFDIIGAEAEINDLNLNNVDINSNQIFSTIGSLAGHNNGTIENVSVSGSIKTGFTNIGGIVGYNSGKISKSHSSVQIKDFWKEGGCLAGGNSGVIEESTSNCSIECAQSCGGLVGKIWQNGKIIDSNASGPVRTTSPFIVANKYLGGLAGEASPDGYIDDKSWWSESGTELNHACGIIDDNHPFPSYCNNPQKK